MNKLAKQFGRSLAIALPCTLMVGGCTSVPRTAHEESRQQILALRSELLQSQNQVAKLKTQNRDVVTRAVEDARRIAALEAANERLEQSVVAYQAERDEYARSLREIKQMVMASANRPQASVSEPQSSSELGRFVADHAEVATQTGPGWVALKTSDLFEANRPEELSTSGQSLLNDLAADLGVAPSISSDLAIRKTSEETGNSLAERRAQRVGGVLGSAVSVTVDADWVRMRLSQTPLETPRS